MDYKKYIKKTSIVLLVLTLLFSVTLYAVQHIFTLKKWFNEPEKRFKIVDHMLRKHNLLGMTKEQVINLLGEEVLYADSRTSFKISREYYEPENTLVYYLGVQYMDDMWLIISLTDDIVSGYIIDVT